MSTLSSTYRTIKRRFFVAIVAALMLLSKSNELRAEDDTASEIALAELLGDTVIPTTTFGRQPVPLDQIAENVTVITTEDIERLQARTLSDLLQYYPGVVSYPMRRQGDLSVPMVQGLPNRQTLIAMDGVPLNSGSDGAVDIGLIYLGTVERVEIVKGPAASVWGRSVGAVINVVTKVPDRSTKFSGKLLGSLGTKQTESGEVVVSGYFPETGTGYFGAAGALQTKGFQKGINGESNGIRLTLTQDIGPKTLLSAAFTRSSNDSNLLYLPAQNIRGVYDATTVFSTLALNHQFNPSSTLDAMFYVNNYDVRTNFFNLAPIPFAIPIAGVRLQHNSFEEVTQGVMLSYKLNKSKYWLTLGVDASTSKLDNTDFSLAPPPRNIVSQKYPAAVGEYISGGYNVTDKLTLTGSYRYDWHKFYEDTHSPSVGLVYKLTENSLLRSTYSYGYSLPTVASNSSTLERLWRVQLGLETNDIPGVWLKTNVFYDRTKNVKLQLRFFDQNPEVNHALTREGVEVELKTVPILHTSLGLGYTYTHIYNTDTESEIKGLPRHHMLLSANYRNHGTDATLVGRYIDWNNDSASHDQLVWDLLINQTVYSWEGGNAKLNFSVKNIFNANQQTSPTFTNPPFRIDAGFTVNF